MARHAELRSYKADCAWQADFGGGPSSATDSSRTLEYEAPNKFKVVSTHSGKFIQTSVSDGKEVLESAVGAPVQPMKSAAPAGLASATSMFMQHPMFCGSLLYKFFGGPDSLSSLADTTKGPIKFGPDETLDGDACKTVTFYAIGTYGSTQAVIRTSDGMVRRIRYGSEPLLAMMKSQLGDKAPKLTATTETYQHIKKNGAIAASEFVLTVPVGQKVMEMPQMPTAGGETKPPVPLGQPAPEFSLAGVGGGTAKLSSLRGKVVLLDFWATWCPPCRKGLPETDKLHKELAGKGLAVLAISDEKKETVTPFLQKAGYTFPAYLDTDQAATKAYQVAAIPTVVIIDREGKLAAYMVGLQTPDKIRGELKKLGI